MAKIKTDFGAGVEIAPVPMPIGSFIIRIDKIEVKPSKASNLPTMYINGECVSHGEEGHRVFFTVSLSDKAQFRLGQLLVFSNLYEEDELKGQFDFDTDDLIGQEIGVNFTPTVDNDGNPTTEAKSFTYPEKCGGPTGEDYEAVATAAAVGGLEGLL